MARAPLSILPPPDLLDQLEGIEPGLRRLQSVGEAGTVGSLIAAVGLVASWAATSLRGVDLTSDPLWYVAIGAAVLLVGFTLLIGWTRVRLRESRSPFRYECTVFTFRPVAPVYADSALASLSHDLERLLSERVSRFRFRNESDPPSQAATATSHISISGWYVIRPESDGRVLEVTPRVAIGIGAPSALARVVVVKLKDARGAATQRSDAPTDAPPETPDVSRISKGDYARVLERVYYHVATQVYEQIESDVERKIELMPTAHLRGVALFHEALDYARSNTLYAYDRAAALFERAVAELAPSLALVDPEKLSPRARFAALFDVWFGWTRRFLARYFPGIASRDIVASRALLLYARACVYRHTLASLSGSRARPTFDALLAVQRAQERIGQCPVTTPGYGDAAFELAVSAALAHADLGDLRSAEHALYRARTANPRTADQDSRFIYALAETISHRRTQLGTFRLAAELDSRFQIAQAQVAFCAENLWRARSTFEELSGDLVLEEYNRLLALDPGNLAGYANAGYVNWLLGRPATAEELLTRGRDYKDIRSESYVSELDYGLARIAAEQGEFDTAYRHYVAAMVGLANEPAASLYSGYTQYHFEFSGRAMLARFDQYRQNVEAQVRSSGKRTVRRHVRSVEAFMLNDYGDLCASLGRTGDGRWIDAARLAYRHAIEKNREFSLPWVNLWKLANSAFEYEDHPGQESLDAAWDRLRLIQEFVRVEPARATGLIAEMRAQAQIAYLEMGRMESLVASVTEEGGEPLSGARVHAIRAQGAWTEVQVLASRALPFDWLWDVGRIGPPRFRWEVIPRSAAPELRWLREIGPVEVECLSELAVLSNDIAVRRGALRVDDELLTNSLWAIPGFGEDYAPLAGMAAPSPRHLYRLLDFLATWYQPYDLATLQMLMALVSSQAAGVTVNQGQVKAAEIEDRFRDAVDRAIAEDARNGFVLSWIPVAFKNLEDRFNRYRRYLETTAELPMCMYERIGDDVAKAYTDSEVEILKPDALVPMSPGFGLARRAYVRGSTCDGSALDHWRLAKRLTLFGARREAISVVRRGRAIDAASAEPVRSELEWADSEAAARAS